MPIVPEGALGPMPEYEVSFCCLRCRQEIEGATRVGHYLYPTNNYCGCINSVGRRRPFDKDRLPGLFGSPESKNRRAKALA